MTSVINQFIIRVQVTGGISTTTLSNEDGAEEEFTEEDLQLLHDATKHYINNLMNVLPGLPQDSSTQGVSDTLRSAIKLRQKLVRLVGDDLSNNNA